MFAHHELCGCLIGLFAGFNLELRTLRRTIERERKQNTKEEVRARARVFVCVCVRWILTVYINYKLIFFLLLYIHQDSGGSKIITKSL